MFKHRLPPTLRKKGFAIISTDYRAELGPWKKIDTILRHPAALVVIGFLLSGVLGAVLTDRFQNQKREEDARRKSVDEVRLSIDNTNRSLNEFIGAAYDLEQDLTSGAPPEQIAKSRVILREARHKAKNSLIFETARIRQQMPYRAGEAFELVTNVILVGTGLASDCLTLGKVEDVPEHGPYGKGVSCYKEGSQFSFKYAADRISKVSDCISVFYADFRPSPLEDDHPDLQIEHLNNAIERAGKVCNNEVMLGILPHQANR